MSAVDGGQHLWGEMKMGNKFNIDMMIYRPTALIDVYPDRASNVLQSIYGFRS